MIFSKNILKKTDFKQEERTKKKISGKEEGKSDCLFLSYSGAKYAKINVVQYVIFFFRKSRGESPQMRWNSLEKYS